MSLSHSWYKSVIENTKLVSQLFSSNPCFNYCNSSTFSSIVVSKYSTIIVAIRLFDGGTIALIEDGDIISIDTISNKLDVKLSNEQLVRRKSQWVAPAIKVTNGMLYKYAQNVSSASQGCVTDENKWTNE